MASSSSCGTIATLVLWGRGRPTFLITDIDLSTYTLTSDELVNVCCLRVSKLSKDYYSKDAFWNFCLNNLPLMEVLISIQFEFCIEEHSVIEKFDNMMRYNQIHYHMNNITHARYIICSKIMSCNNPYKKLTLPEFIRNKSKISSDSTGKNVVE